MVMSPSTARLRGSFVLDLVLWERAIFGFSPPVVHFQRAFLQPVGMLKGGLSIMALPVASRAIPLMRRFTIGR